MHGQKMVPWKGDVALPGQWLRCPPYLLGVDLFNRAYFWEAHESWEEIWHGVQKSSTVGRFTQGLIQCSAALLRLHLGTPGGARSLFDKAKVHFDQVPEQESFMGLQLPPWIEGFDSYLSRETNRFPFLTLELDS